MRWALYRLSIKPSMGYTWGVIARRSNRSKVVLPKHVEKLNSDVYYHDIGYGYYEDDIVITVYINEMHPYYNASLLWSNQGGPLQAILRQNNHNCYHKILQYFEDTIGNQIIKLLRSQNII